MDYRVNKEKMNQAVEYLNQLGIDLWVILTSEGSDPCLPLITGVKTVGPGAFIISKDGTKYAICSLIDAQDIEESGLFDRVIKYNAGLEQPFKELILSMNPSKIALNFSEKDNLCDGLTVGRYRWLINVIGDEYKGEIVSSEEFLKKLRSIKTPEEVRRISRAIEITLDIYDAVFKQLKTGISEKEVGQIFLKEMEKRNVVSGTDRTLSMPIILKERIAHRGPGDAIINPGDFLIMDFSIDSEGYVSDIARTVYFLKPGETEAPDGMKAVFNGAREAITVASKVLKPGVYGYEVDLAARNYLLSIGMPEISHATGHQVGRECHDGGVLLGPRWERYGDAPYGKVEEGMVFTLEPTILRENNYSIILEENVLVTKDGVKFLSKRNEDLILIG